MKIPDRIYIQTNAGETISSKWTTIPFRDFENTEYIRKDALLDFLRKEISCLPPRSESEFEKILAIHNAIIYGQCTTMQIILNKIQSL